MYSSFSSVYSSSVSSQALSVLKKIAESKFQHIKVKYQIQRISQLKYEIYQMKFLQIYFKLNLIRIMELSIDQKIKLALDPILERIAALEAENKSFKQEISALQPLSQPKISHKPPPKQSFGYGQKPQTAKNHLKQSQLHEVKPELKGNHKLGQKKEGPKIQNEEGKSQDKPIAPKSSNPTIKLVSHPATQKDHNDPKNIIPKPTTNIGNKPTIGANIKTAANDKKPAVHKNNQTQPQKKEQVKHTSQQKQHKNNSTYGIKSPMANKHKPSQKQLDKKPIVAASPAPGNKKHPIISQKPEPKPLKGGKSVPVVQPQVKVQQLKQQIQTQKNQTDQVKSQQSQLLQSQFKEESKEAQVKTEVNGQLAQKKEKQGKQGVQAGINEETAEKVVADEAKDQSQTQKKQAKIAGQQTF